MLSLPQYLIVKLLDAYIVFCKVFYTHLLYLFLLWQINTCLLTYLVPKREQAIIVLLESLDGNHKAEKAVADLTADELITTVQYDYQI